MCFKSGEKKIPQKSLVYHIFSAPVDGMRGILPAGRRRRVLRAASGAQRRRPGALLPGRHVVPQRRRARLLLQAAPLPTRGNGRCLSRESQSKRHRLCDRGLLLPLHS